MNPILTLTHNALELTKKAVESFLGQDSPVGIYIIDNGSTDGTVPWLEELGLCLENFPCNQGVSAGWNHGLEMLFSEYKAEHVLVTNNDVQLPPWFYSELVSYDVPFVTGVSVDSMDAIKNMPPRSTLVSHPDFSAFLIRRDAWEKIGPFDEYMKFYASDCDYHIRASQVGISLMAANLPFYHERSSTLKMASAADREGIERQANADRACFERKYGFAVGSEQYQKATSVVAGTPIPFPGEVR